MLLHPRSKDRPFHLGPFPLESLLRDKTVVATETGRPAISEEPSSISRIDNVLSRAADHYREGWFTGFFDYFNAASSPFGGGGTWTESQVGAGDRALTDGAWDGLSFAPNFTATSPDEPAAAAAAAVPEPTLGLLAFVGAASFVASRSRRARRHV